MLTFRCKQLTMNRFLLFLIKGCDTSWIAQDNSFISPLSKKSLIYKTLVTPKIYLNLWIVKKKENVARTTSRISFSITWQTVALRAILPKQYLPSETISPSVLDKCSNTESDYSFNWALITSEVQHQSINYEAPHTYYLHLWAEKCSELGNKCLPDSTFNL